MGIALVVASTCRKMPSSTKLMTTSPITQGLPHGSSLPPRLNPINCKEMAETSKTAPRKSTRFQTRSSPLLREEAMPGGLGRTLAPNTSASMAQGTWAMKHQRQPIVSAMLPPNAAPAIAPNPTMPFCMAWYIPRLRKGMRSELMIVAEQSLVSKHRRKRTGSYEKKKKHLPMVMRPAPPMPASALMKMRVIMVGATPQPRQPTAKATEEMKKQMRRPKMSETRPYNG